MNVRPDHMANLRQKVSVVAAMVGMGSRDFGLGWADGMARWRRRWHIPPAAGGPVTFEFAPCKFPPGSTARGASEAAITYMRETSGQ